MIDGKYTLLLEYGFVLPRNPYNYCSFDHHIHALCDKQPKLALLLKEHFMWEYVFYPEIYISDLVMTADGPSWRLWMVARAFGLQQHEWKLWVDVKQGARTIVRAENEQFAAQFIRDICSLTIKSLPVCHNSMIQQLSSDTLALLQPIIDTL